MAEKSRLAQENANLVRENQSLVQLVEYHQLTSQDLTASYEQFIEGVCLDFSSPVEKATGESSDEGEAPVVATSTDWEIFLFFFVSFYVNKTDQGVWLAFLFILFLVFFYGYYDIFAY